LFAMLAPSANVCSSELWESTTILVGFVRKCRQLLSPYSLFHSATAHCFFIFGRSIGKTGQNRWDFGYHDRFPNTRELQLWPTTPLMNFVQV
jgi:hypothetical protein